jgi:hypothetical protein
MKEEIVDVEEVLDLRLIDDLPHLKLAHLHPLAA